MLGHKIQQLLLLWNQAAALIPACASRDENMVAIDLITEHIRMKLQQPDLRRIHHNLEVIPSNFQTRGASS